MATCVAPGWMRTPMPVDEPSRHLASGTGMKVQVSGGASMGAPGTTPERQSATLPSTGLAGSVGPLDAGAGGATVPTALEQAVSNRQRIATRMVPLQWRSRG